MPLQQNSPRSSLLNPRTLQQLITLMQENSEAVLQLQKHLEKEQHCLRKNNPIELQKLLEDKARALVATQEAESKLEHLLKQLQHTLSRESLSDLIAKAPPPHQSTLKAHWQNLQHRLSACKQLNQINGKVLTRIQIGLSNVLSTLKGQDPTQQVYKSSGMTHNHCTTRVIAQA